MCCQILRKLEWLRQKHTLWQLQSVGDHVHGVQKVSRQVFVVTTWNIDRSSILSLACTVSSISLQIVIIRDPTCRKRSATVPCEVISQFFNTNVDVLLSPEFDWRYMIIGENFVAPCLSSSGLPLAERHWSDACRPGRRRHSVSGFGDFREVAAADIDWRWSRQSEELWQTGETR